jgi:hypothetical protein
MTNDVIPVVQLQNAVFASDTHWQLDGWDKFASCAADIIPCPGISTSSSKLYDRDIPKEMN